MDGFMGFNTPFLAEFTRQAAAAARAHFGADNVGAVWNDADTGSFVIHMQQGGQRAAFSSLNDLHVNLVMTGKESMDIHFGHTPFFNSRMFNRTVEIVESQSTEAGWKIDTAKTTPVSRQITISQLDVTRLRKQAGLVAAAIDMGIRNPVPEGTDSGIDCRI